MDLQGGELESDTKTTQEYAQQIEALPGSS